LLLVLLMMGYETTRAVTATTTSHTRVSRVKSRRSISMVVTVMVSWADVGGRVDVRRPPRVNPPRA